MFFDFLLHFRNWIIHGSKSCHWFPIFIHHKFGEIPLDRVAKEATLFVFKKHPHRMGFTAIHINFFIHIKFNTIALSKLFYFTISTRLLSPKLITRKSKDGQTIPSFVILVVQLHQLGIVGPGLSSLGSDVDDDAHLPLVLAHVNHVAVDVLGCELVERTWLTGFCKESYWAYVAP